MLGLARMVTVVTIVVMREPLISYLLTVCQAQTSALLIEDTFTYVDLSTHAHAHAHTYTHSFNYHNRSVYASENSSEWTATKTELTE